MVGLDATGCKRTHHSSSTTTTHGSRHRPPSPVSTPPPVTSAEPSPRGSLRRRAFKLVYLAYYRLLFGRRFPGSAALARRVRAWEQATGRGDAPAPKERWEEQYRSGHWELMRRSDELARYGVIAAYLRRLHPAGSVLDVGSGEGILREHLAGGRYTGIDLSEVAVARGRAAAGDDANTSFHAADAEAWSPPDPDQRFDAVVFNECVYYFEEPVATVLRYRQWLAPGGTLVVSAFRSRRADVIRRRIAAALPAVDEVAVMHRKGSWVVSIHRP